MQKAASRPEPGSEQPQDDSQPPAVHERYSGVKVKVMSNAASHIGNPPQKICLLQTSFTLALGTLFSAVELPSSYLAPLAASGLY